MVFFLSIIAFYWVGVALPNAAAVVLSRRAVGGAGGGEPCCCCSLDIAVASPRSRRRRRRSAPNCRDGRDVQTPCEKLALLGRRSVFCQGQQGQCQSPSVIGRRASPKQTAVEVPSTGLVSRRRLALRKPAEAPRGPGRAPTPPNEQQTKTLHFLLHIRIAGFCKYSLCKNRAI